jgi:hypothetical protein
VPPGSYIIEAALPGLLVSEAVTAVMGKVAEISLELKPSAVQDSVTVTANAHENETTSASPTGTVTASTLQKAPNIDDRAESILPTLPGVVRGPDGRINLKGARSTQSGALANSANATDPATGNPGIALPIDVVSSVQVISNPYDPQYGKLTGAVSTLETKTSNFEGFHASIQNFMPRVRVIGGDRRLMTRVGLAAFNLFNPRDVQNSEESARFGGFSNNAWREYRGKFVVEF